MTVLFDTNVILDVLQERKPHLQDSAWAFRCVEANVIRGLLGATTLTTVYYIIGKDPGVSERDARDALQRLLRLFDVAAVNRGVLEQALAAGFDDYEDGVLHKAGHRAGAEALVTRNVSDFDKAQLSVYTPRQLRAALEDAP